MRGAAVALSARSRAARVPAHWIACAVRDAREPNPSESDAGPWLSNACRASRRQRKRQDAAVPSVGPGWLRQQDSKHAFILSSLPSASLIASPSCIGSMARVHDHLLAKRRGKQLRRWGNECAQFKRSSSRRSNVAQSALSREARSRGRLDFAHKIWSWAESCFCLIMSEWRYDRFAM